MQDLGIIEKIVVNIGVGKAHSQAHFEDRVLPEIEKEVMAITGQKPSARPSRKSEAGFKVRVGEVVGLKVTLRRKRMRDFLARFINIVLPRVRDFRGLALSSVDRSGNLNVGLRDKNVFPEIDPNESKVDFGVQVTVVSRSRNREKMLEAYRALGIPFASREEPAGISGGSNKKKKQ